MARYHAEIGKLIIYNSQKSKTFVGCFVAQPKLEEERLGQIFIIAEIKQKNIAGMRAFDCQKFIDILISSIKNNYYGKSKSSNEFGLESIELLFEAALQKTNRDLQTYLLANEKKGAENFLSNANIILGVSLKHQVHFAAVGSMEAFLARKNRISNVLAASQETTQGQVEEKINPVKIFCHLISGSLENDDGLIFATPSLLDYFSLEKIKRIIKENPTKKAIQNINSLLAEIDEKTAVAVVLIKLALGPMKAEGGAFRPKPSYKQPKKKLMARKPEQRGVEDSIADLLNRREETNKIITPTIGGTIKKIVPGFLRKGGGHFDHLDKLGAGKLKFFEKIKKPRTDLSSRLGETIKNYKQGPDGITKHFPCEGREGKKLKIGFGWLRSIFSKMPRIKKKRTIKLKKSSSGISGSSQRTKGGRRKFGLTSKVILGVCILLGILFVQSLFTLNKKRSDEKKKEEFLQEIKELGHSSERANSRLIIGDKKSAADTYLNILEAIRELEAEGKEQEEQVELLKDKIIEKIKEINRTKKADLNQVLDLGMLTFFSEDMPERIIKMGEDIFIISATGIFYEYSLETGEIKQKGEFSLGKIKKVRRFDEDALIINYESSLALFDIGNGAVTSLVIAGRDDLEITDFEIYNNRLYLLDAEKNLILRYSKSGDAFIREVGWLKDNINLKEAKSLAIDGSIWILTSAGEIKNLMKGLERDLNFDEVRPRLIQASGIWTEDEEENIYFMDAGSGRIIAMTKEGEIRQQYMADFLDLKGFVVDEAGDKIYVLDDKMIYGFDIE